jgi:hypothetical protein
MMMAAAILFVSVLAFVLFLVAYCRSLVASAAHYPLSMETQDVAGIGEEPAAQDFVRLTQLLRLLPNYSQVPKSLHLVRAYYWILSLAEAMVGNLAPSAGNWAGKEQASCARFAALVLDRGIALSLQAAAEQARF